jgi:hypothetical protein
MSKRFDPTYSQISAYVPKELARRFKIACAEREINQSEAMEQMITTWLMHPEVTSSDSKLNSESKSKVAYASLADLVADHWENLTQTQIPLDRLEALCRGDKPTSVEQVFIGLVCEDIDLVIRLAEKIPIVEKKEGNPWDLN